MMNQRHRQVVNPICRYEVVAVVVLLIAVPAVTSDCFASDLTERETAFLKTHCLDCHGSETSEGDITLHNISDVTTQNAVLWQKVLNQIATAEMPPDGEPQPNGNEREALITWLSKSLTAIGITPRLPSGPLPADGNLVAHERLFSGNFKGPSSSPPRFWRRSQSQYDALMEQLWVIPRLRYEKSHTRSDAKWAGYGYSQPFPTLDPDDFTNFAGSIHADQATLRALLEAGGQVAERLTSDATSYAKELQPPIAAGVPSIKRGSHWEQFKVEPPSRPGEFKPFLVQGVAPQQEERDALIRRVFQLLLSRVPNEVEIGRYRKLLDKSLEKSGNLAALRGLIVAVFVSPRVCISHGTGDGAT